MVENVLAWQLVHVGEPPSAHVPAEHEWHTIAFVAPSMGDEVPLGQFVHALAPAYEYVPGVQMSTRISSLIDCVMVTCWRFDRVSSAESWLASTGVSLLLMLTFTAICCWACVNVKMVASSNTYGFMGALWYSMDSAFI